MSPISRGSFFDLAFHVIFDENHAMISDLFLFFMNYSSLSTGILFCAWTDFFLPEWIDRYCRC